MHISQKIIELRKIIDQQIRPLVRGDYVLLDAPYYRNVGDVLIWQGIYDFCKSLSGNNMGTSSITTCMFPIVPKDTTILLTGGGNFGDLWRHFQDFRLQVIRRYPDNRIIILPQSLWYNDITLIKRDVEIFASHNNLYICARDDYSCDFLLKYFGSNNILKVPDMAFYISDDFLSSEKPIISGKKLYLRRLDKEFVEGSPSRLISGDEYEIHDWPTFEKTDIPLVTFRWLQGLTYRTKNIQLLNKILPNITDKLAHSVIRKRLVQCGVNFLSPYSEIVTTRLHTMILGLLLDRSVRYIDNSSGKLSAFARTWLSDVDNLRAF